MKAILKEVGKKPIEVEIENTLEALQKAVGGYFKVNDFDDGLVMLYNEEGEIKGLPVNFETCLGYIFGDVLFVQDGGEELIDLSDKNKALVFECFEKK